MKDLFLRTPEMKKFLVCSISAAVLFIIIPIILYSVDFINEIILFVLIATGSAVLLGLGYFHLRNSLLKAREASEFTDRAMKENFSDTLPEVDEGIYYTLNHNINLLVKRQESISENLMKEKEFLKNLVSDISHQMKTPLSSLILNNELMSKKYPDDELLAIGRGQLDRMEVLVINLLKYARLEADSVIFTPDRDDVMMTINNSIKAIKAAADMKNIVIRFNPKGELKFDHDGSWLEEALINILKNAVEHTPDDGTISVTLKSTGISNNIVIEDTGSGIPEDELPHIFDRFYKGKSGTNPSSIGIGLSLSRLITEGLGGTVRAENTLPSGARFTLSFPTY